MNRRQLLATVAIPALARLTGPAMAATLSGTLYKSEYCTCCESHAAYLHGHGISLTIKPIENAEELDAIRAEAGVPSAYQGCHTIFLDGYVFEGHISFELIGRLLNDRPTDIIALALPGMPAGVPGMDGDKTGPIDVFAIKKDGTATVFGTQ